MTIPFPMPTFPSPTAAMPPDSIAFIARGNDNQIIAGLNQVEASIAALGHTLTFGTHLQAAGTSYNGSANVTIATDATSANTVSTIVARDSSGNFSANSVTLAGTLTLSSNGAILSGASGSKGLAITATTGEILDYSTTGQNGDMPAGGILVNSGLTTGHRALSIFANDGTAGITVGAYYFTNSAVETVWQYANAIGKAQGSTAFQFYPKGGEVSFGQNYAASGNTKAFIRMYGTTTSNAGGSATLIVQQGGITTDTLAASALISANGGLTVASGQTLTLTGVTVVGLSFTPITGNLTYAQLPTGNGTWDTGAGTLITIARSITVSGTTSTVGFTVSNTASFLNASPFAMSGGGGNVVTVAITLPTAGATVTIPDFAGVNDTFAFVTLAQTLANKTLASSCVVPASTLTGNIAYAALPSGNGSWDTGAGTTLTVAQSLAVGTNTTASSSQISINAIAGQVRQLAFLTAGILRWEWHVDTSAESGSNAGSNISLTCFDDSGTTITTAIRASRATGSVAIGNAPQSNTNFRVAGGVTASAGLASTTVYGAVLTAAANGDTLEGLNIATSYAPGLFTGLVTFGIVISGWSTAGFSSPSNATGLSILTITGTGAPRATSIELGNGPIGATNNYLIHATNFQVTSAGALTLGASCTVATGFGCNGKTAQTAFASGGAAPAGGTGTAAGGWDTAAHRDAAITLLNNIRSALVANGIMS